MDNKFIENIAKSPSFIVTSGIIGIFSGILSIKENIVEIMNDYSWLYDATLLSLIWGVFVFSTYSYYKPKNLYVLKDTANATRNLDTANFYFKSHNNINLPLEVTWESWISDIKKADDFKDIQLLDYYNFGKYFYFFDLDTGNEINIPTSEKARTEKVGDSFKKGMVLRLMPRET